MPAVAAAAPAAAPKVDAGDTAWLLTSSALVMLMTPGLALFYAGMVRRKNVLGTIMHSFIALGVITLQWVLFGYSLAFGPDVGHVIGSLAWVGLKGVGLEPNADYAATVPHQAFMIFQMMFAVITPALITGTFAERFKFSTYLVFLVLWSTLVYDPLAHWVWGIGGWIREMGALDFAGGLVVHISSGVAALAAALVVGKRRGYGTDLMAPHNLTMTVRGRRTPVVRLVRFQRRQCRSLRVACHLRLRGDPHRHGRGGTVLDVRGMGPSRQTHGAGCGIRRRGRSGGHYPGIRFRRTNVGGDHRPGGWSSLLSGRKPQEQARL